MRRMQKKRQQEYEQQHKEEFENEQDNFQTLVSKIPCNTIEFELAKSAETSVVNWYQCVGNWRLQWLVVDIQDLISSEGKSVDKIKRDIEQGNISKEEQKRRINNEKVTPEKQSIAADKFFRALR